MAAPRIANTPGSAVGEGVHAVRVFGGAGLLRPVRPDKLVRSGMALARWGSTPAAGLLSSTIYRPHAPAVIDERGELTFEQLDRRTNAIARALSRRGIGPGSGVAIMCRD